MLGDMLDMSLILRSARALCSAVPEPDSDDEEEGEPDGFLFSKEIRGKIAAATRDLVACFDSVERAHRKQYGLSGDKKPPPVRDSPPNCPGLHC